MSRAADSRVEIVSGATLAGLSFDLPVNRATLEEHLRRLGPLMIDPGPDGGLACLACELWTVTDGRAMPLGIDQHELLAGWAGMVAGMTATALTAGLGRAGIERAIDTGREYGKRGSRAVALGPYHELLVGVPNVRVGDGPTRYLAVLGMITDSPVARSIDGWFGYGYGKVLGRFTREGDGRVEVHVDGRNVLCGQFELNEGTPAPTARVDERWDQPLLGGLGERRLRAAALRRHLDGARCENVRGEVALAWPVVPGAPSGKQRLGGEAPGSHAVVFEGVESRIGSPEPVG